MALSTKTKASLTVASGIDGTEASGLITDTGLATISSVEVNVEYTVNSMIKDDVGEFAAHLYGDEKQTIKADGYGAANTLPTLGADITYAGRQAVVTSIGVTASNEDFVKASVSAEGFVGTY